MHRLLPYGIRQKVLRIILGYDSFAPSFASAGEDMILRHLLGADRAPGFYVDVGACHPVRASNTYSFYLRGWRGINIDASPGSMSEFKRMRPRDINLEIGIGSSTRVDTFYVVSSDMDAGASMNSFSGEFLKDIGMMKRVARQVPVGIQRLEDVLAKHLPEGQTLDFMSIDVEGRDLDVVESNDWRRFRPTVVVLETDVQTSRQPTAITFLEKAGYSVVGSNPIILGSVQEYFLYDIQG